MNELETALEAIAEYVDARNAEREAEAANDTWEWAQLGVPHRERTREAQESAAAALATAIDARASFLISERTGS